MFRQLSLAAVITPVIATFILLAPTRALGQETQRQYLSGRGTDDAVAWEFYCTSGAKSRTWTTIPVPSCWDALGFGTLNYQKDSEPAEQGKYRRNFAVPQSWRGQTIVVVFDGVMTDARVWVNGQSAGEKHQGAFYRFSYDITKLIKFDGAVNLIEVTVDKHSSNESINRAERGGDYWLFGGIFRPVWLEARPVQHIERIAIDARHDGGLAADVLVSAGTQLEAQVMSLDGADVGAPFAARVSEGKALLETKIDSPKQWTAETPNLYQVEVRLRDADGKILHRMRQRFGFRTIEVRKGDGIYVNGVRVLLKGTNRHSFWPESGRATNEKLSRDDVLLMKEMNCNAVRMSHYSPDEHFLDACDELGLYVLDELAGWQKPYDDTPTARRLVGELVRRDVNHPSILLWDNGNEGGWNNDVNDDFSKWDPQKRDVIHPWELFRNINARHYRSYEEHAKLCQGPDVYMPTEFLHGLFDGGAGAGLGEYWDATQKSKFAGGGFIWAFCDEAVRRPDTGKMDTAGNRAPDGVVGPYREKEGSFFAIKEIWSPVVVKRPGGFVVENRYAFTNTRDCKFTWQLRKFRSAWDEKAGHQVMAQWTQPIEVPPGGKKNVIAEVPRLESEIQPDAISLRVDDPQGRELWTWVWDLKSGKSAARMDQKSAIPFDGGVRIAGPGKVTKSEWHVGDDGWAVLDYAYTCDGTLDFHGISFDLPEKEIRSMRWLGQGPFRVWKNRPEGGTLGVWENSYNDTQTGYSEWKYPEFKGYYGGVRWMRLETIRGPIVMELEDPALFVQVGKPKFPGDPKPVSPTTAATQRAPRDQLSGNAWTLFPDAGLSILHAIPPIGSKFQLANTTGPRGQQNAARGGYRGRVRFYVGEAK